MPTILRTIGNQFRLVGPLTLANGFVNPSFEAVTGSTPDNWTAIGNASLVTAINPAIFGVRSCQVNVSSGIPINSGLSQTLQSSFNVGQTYTFSTYFNILSPLPSPLACTINFYDYNNALLSIQGGNLSTGVPTNGWTRAAYSVVVPDQTQSIVVSVFTQASVTTSFYLDAMMWNIGPTPDPYADGDFAGYVWANLPNGITLLSATPDSLRIFDSNRNPVPVTS